MIHRTMLGRGVLFAVVSVVLLFIAGCPGPDAMVGDADSGGATGSSGTDGSGGSSSSSGGVVELRGEFAAAAFYAKDPATTIELQGRMGWAARVQGQAQSGITLEGWLR